MLKPSHACIRGLGAKGKLVACMLVMVAACNLCDAAAVPEKWADPQLATVAEAKAAASSASERLTYVAGAMLTVPYLLSVFRRRLRI